MSRIALAFASSAPNSSILHWRRLGLGLLLGACVSCAGPGSEASMDPAGEAVHREVQATQPRTPEPPKPWTEAFRGKAVLFAADIVVSGPAQLLNHSALNTDISLYAVQQQRTPQGFEQLAVVRPNVGREVRCQLDGWKLAASNSIRIIARPGPCDVEVLATGEAFWKDVDGHEQRGDKLEFVGKIP